jgi:small subunit ribosomal protein S16
MGRKKKPAYRIVVAEKSVARNGRFIETLGHYNPRTEPTTLKLDIDRARQWIHSGATPSDTVRSLFKKAGVFGVAAEPVAETPAAEAPPAEG